MDSKSASLFVRFAAVLALTLWSAVTVAEPWDFGLNVDLGIIHTDNVRLATEGLEESETVFTVVPEFLLSKDSERLQADIRYRPEGYFYSDTSDANDIYHVLDATLTAALVRNRFFIAMDATNSQSIVTPDDRYPTTNLPISSNRVDATTLGIRPYWQQPLGQATMLVEADFRRVEYDNSFFQESDYGEGHFRLDNIDNQQGLAWALDYRFRRIEYETALPYEFQRASVNLGFWISGTVRVFAEGGSETPFDNFVDSTMDSDFWEGGVQYRPNQRLDLEVAIGDRSYGESYRGRLRYELRRGNITATYTEAPTTRADQAFGRRPIIGTDSLDGLLDRPGASDRYVRKRGEVSVNIELAKSDLTVRVFDERRERRTAAGGTPLPDEDFSGAAIRWAWNMGTKTRLGIGADISDRNQGTRDDELLQARVDVTYQLSQRLSLSAEVIHSSQEARESSFIDYDENQARLFLRSEF